MPLKSRDLESILQSKFGFSLRFGDHRWLKLDLPGLPAIMTKVSHGSGGEIYSELEGRIRTQLRVRKKFFRAMIDCTQGVDDYERQLWNDPYPPFDVYF